jgi:hydroxymethylbilane synthase
MSTTPLPEEGEVTQPDRYDNEETSKPKIFVGGRKSKLAVIQSRYVANCLRDVHPGLTFPVIALSTLGDKVHNRPLYAFGGKALWTKELETLLLNHIEGFEQIDMIVHSLKDMPTQLPEGCILGAITKREDPRDALVMSTGSAYKSLKDLPDGSVVGTSSIRRSAQLKRRYPNLIFESVRGTVQTRIDKLDDPNTPYACIILAVAGMVRLGLEHRITSRLEPPDMYYAVGQGALGVEIRVGDEKVNQLVSRINHKPTSMCCLAERSLMRTLEGGCSVPIGVESNYKADEGLLTLSGIVVSVDGSEFVEGTVASVVYTDTDAEQAGKDLAADLIAKGAKKILDDIHLDQIN